MPYRQLEGFTRALEILMKVSTGDYAVLRKRIILVDIMPFSNLAQSEEPLSIALDSTSVRVLKAGGWMEKQHRVKKKYLRVHFAVDVKTKEVVAMGVTTEERHNSHEAEKLVAQAGRNAGQVNEVLGDGACDSARICEFLKEKGTDVVIKPRKNSILNTRSGLGGGRLICTDAGPSEMGRGEWLRREVSCGDDLLNIQEDVRRVC